ncbi:MAG: hypothetical protein LBT68_06525, partial [Spirochaetales bacterium]|nr:hypothetical protein [Spirochaetales bacterium]
QAIQSCIKTSNLPDWSQVRMARIHNTLCLSEIEVSENLLDDIAKDKRFEILSEPYDMQFNAEGDLF